MLLYACTSSARSGAPLTVLVLDVDRMGRVNDQLGHHAGDRLIAGVASVLLDRVRGADIVARLGGDEFGLLLPDTSPAGAEAVAKSLRRAIGEVRIGVGEGVLRAWTTVSIGVATAADDPDSLLGRAHAAMYEAKREGGDRVTVARAAAPVG